jgi:hypothetical protein
MEFNEGDIEVGILLNLQINNKNRMDFLFNFGWKAQRMRKSSILGGKENGITKNNFFWMERKPK